MDTENDSESAPDLQSILATLARFAPPPASTSTDIRDGNLSSTPASIATGVPPSHSTGAEPTTDQKHKPQSRANTAISNSVIDPATITTWQDGLRCVTKIAAENVQFAASIRRLMHEERAQEMRWYSERQNLKQVLVDRSSSIAKAHSILQSLTNGSPDSLSADSQPEIDIDAELAEFDRKLHAAQQTVEIKVTAELKALGVPFFGTNPKLVRPESYDISDQSLTDGHPKWSPPITERELMELRRKMIGHLEDLYRD